MVAAAGAHAQIWTSGFETQDFSEWTGLASAAADQPTIDSTYAHSGTFSALSPGAGAPNGYYKNIGAVDAALTTTLTFYMSLESLSPNSRHYSELRSYAGDAFATGALEQLIAVGAYNATTNVIDSSGNVTTGSSTAKWQARLAFGGGYANGGWFQLDQAADRTTDWTRFDIVVSPTEVQFYVDGVAGLATALSRGGDSWTADSVVMGSRLTSSGGWRANFDDFSVDAVPEPASMVVLAGVAALVARRKRRSA